MARFGARPIIHSSAAAALVAVSLLALPAQATIIWDGAVKPTDFPTTSERLDVGYASLSGNVGSLEINAGPGFSSVTATGVIPFLDGFLETDAVRIGAGSGAVGSIIVIGDGAAGSAVLNTQPGLGFTTHGFVVGHNGGDGTLEVRHGGSVNSQSLQIGGTGFSTGSAGSVVVENPNSSITLTSRLGIAADAGSTGSLTVADGAAVTVGTVFNEPVEIGRGPNSNGSIVVTGPGSTLEMNSGLSVGLGGAGGAGGMASLVVADGGLAVAPAPGPDAVNQASAVQVNAQEGGSASIAVGGAGSRMEVAAIPTGNFYEGFEMAIAGFGNSTVTVEEDAVLEVDGDVWVGRTASFDGWDEGALIVRSGGLLVASAVHVTGPGVLTGGDGVIQADVMLDGGVIAPGDSPGRMDVDGDLLLDVGLLQLEIGDVLAATGTIFLGADLVLELIFDAEPTGDLIDLASFFEYSALVSNFDPETNLRFSGLGDDFFLTVRTLGGVELSFGEAGNGGSIMVREPTSLALFGLALSGLSLLRRRNSRSWRPA